MHPVQQYLSGSERPWAEGVALYEKFGTNSALKFLFSLGETRASFQRLMEALEEIQVQDQNQGTNPDPDIITRLRAEDLALFEEAETLFSQIKLSSISQQERFEKAAGIKKIFRVKEELYHQIQHFEKTGQLPEPSGLAFDASGMTDADLLKRSRTLGSYLAPSKAGKMKNPEQVRAELEAIQKEIEYRGL